jgi:Uncharacterized protein conserved in bacteria (DUF2252)
MNIVQATREFEAWLGQNVSIVKDQLTDKHSEMAKDSIGFLRGTFYRWTQLFPEVCKDAANSVNVLAVGDLHIASFGTWRDEFGRLIWGVDDFDEAFPLPYTNDLVRLGVSAVIDTRAGDLTVGVKNVCDVILDGYGEALKIGGRAFVLEERHKWLRKIALDHLDLPHSFWKKIDALPTLRTEAPAAARKALEQMLPKPRVPYRIARRVAGVGSLGHPRYVAVFEWKGGQLAIEAKQAAPSACAWARSGGGNAIYYEKMLKCAVRCPDPFVRLTGRWLIHQLSPDASPIEIETMNGQQNQDKLLHAMAWEAANIHLGTAQAVSRIKNDLKQRPANWLRSAVKDMAKQTLEDWKEWKISRKSRR